MNSSLLFADSVKSETTVHGFTLAIAEIELIKPTIPMATITKKFFMQTPCCSFNKCSIEENKISEAEMKTWYAKNPQIRLSDILIEVKPGATPEQRAEAKKRAGEILDEVKKSKRPFEELVRLYSDDTTTKGLGGDVGWQSRMTLVPTYYNAANSLKVGEITSSLVETQFGFHVLKLTGRRSYEEATKREIRMSVFDEKRKTIFDGFFSGLKKQYTINVNSKLVE